MFSKSKTGNKLMEKTMEKAMPDKGCMPSLTLKQRIYGFFICAIVGK